MRGKLSPTFPSLLERPRSPLVCIPFGDEEDRPLHHPVASASSIVRHLARAFPIVDVLVSRW